MSLLAVIGAKALWLTYLWLASAMWVPETSCIYA